MLIESQWDKERSDILAKIPNYKPADDNISSKPAISNATNT